MYALNPTTLPDGDRTSLRWAPNCAYLCALQTLARCAGWLALRDAFLIALVKAAFPPRVVAVLDEPQQASSTLPSSVPLEGQPPESDE